MDYRQLYITPGVLFLARPGDAGHPANGWTRDIGETPENRAFMT